MIDPEITQVRLMQRETAACVVANLVAPDYDQNYQPTYQDEDELLDAVHELHITEAVTTPRNVDAMASYCADLALNRQNGPLLIIGGCNERVDANTPITELRKKAQVLLGVVACSAVAASAKTVIRGFGQGVKPRSKKKQKLPDDTVVDSYQGDMVNSEDVAQRQPEPRRMVEGALQARDLAADLEEAEGHHIPAAHEALLLAYEESFIREDPVTGDEYLLSADIPWVGVRTNRPDGDHLQLVKRLKNTIGFKIGAGTTDEHIKALAEASNPDKKPGKHIYMLRLGMENMNELPAILESISTHDPNSILMYDIHGATRTLEDGTKIRLVSDIIDEIKQVAGVCKAQGLRLHGLHLEAMSDDSRLECIDKLGQIPQEGNIDPQLNPRQLKQVLDETAYCWQN